MPVFYDLERQELGTLPASREGNSRWGGDEWPVDYGAVGRARYLFPFVFLVFRTVVRFLKCCGKEVWLRFSGPARGIRATNVLWWNEMGTESFLRTPTTAGSDTRYTFDSPKESMRTVRQPEKHGPGNVHQTLNHRMCCLKGY